MMTKEDVVIYAQIDVKALALRLPREERIRLYEALAESLNYDTEMKCNERRTRVDVLKGYLQEIMGYPNIDFKRRKKGYVIAKALMCYEMTHYEGIRMLHLAQALDTHHTCVLYLVRNVEQWLSNPRCFAYEVDVWKKFRKMIENEDNEAVNE